VGLWIMEGRRCEKKVEGAEEKLVFIEGGEVRGMAYWMKF